MTAAALILPAADIVGESLVWDDRRRRLAWVDIIGRRVHLFDPATGEHAVHPMPFRPTSLTLTESGDALICSERHICRWDWAGAPVPVVEVEPDLPMNRLNEGAAGPDGALWLGSMHQNIKDDDSPADIPAATGRLWRYGPDGDLRLMADDRFGIANTLVWPRPDLLVAGDTLLNTLFAYPLRGDGSLGPRAVWAAGIARGFPDGSCTDAAGRVWNARVAGGAAVACHAPDGTLEALHDLPCLWPTSCAFGGPDLTTLYVTSARFTMTAEHLAAHPQEGALFALPGIGQGRPAWRFSG